MATIATAWRTGATPLRYHAGEITVEPGDIIELRVWFRWRRGIVNYVPGISTPHPEMEHNALYWIGIVRDDGRFVADIVDPDTGRTRKIVRFVARGSASDLPPVPDEPDA